MFHSPIKNTICSFYTCILWFKKHEKVLKKIPVWLSGTSTGKLPTYPSPNPTFYPKGDANVKVDLEKGWVGSFPET